VQPGEIRAALDRLLVGVERPARYLGLEANVVRKTWEDVEVRLLLAFPDEYGIGMSHLGTRILYHIANRRPDTLCERAFAPWPDMARAMREAGIPLYSLESFHPAADFDLIGITLQSELTYVNVPYLLDLAGLPLWASQRDESHPLVVGGGPCMANPEPVADFFDVLAIGDGEVLLPRLLDAQRRARREGWSRLALLRHLAAAEGFYVPAFYRYHPGPGPGRGGRHERLDPAAPERVRRVFAPRLDPADLPEVPLLPAIDVVQDRLALEVARGCTQGCRFCQAGYWYRPVRERSPEDVQRLLEKYVAASGHEEVGLLSLSSADYSQIGPLVRSLAERLATQRVSVSLPSLRADSFSVSLADAVSMVRKSGFTFAPETGSDRLRRVINKPFANRDVVEAARAAFARGWRLVKLYAMVGLPSETDEDVLALGDLAEEVLAAGGRGVQVKVSVGPFVPKAWTAFQWEPFGPVAELERRLALLRQRFRERRTLRAQARLLWGEPREAALEALLARGDRRLARVIARAYELGAVFDGWREWANPAAWERAFAEAGVDVSAELGPRDLDATLPWEILDTGVRRAYLRAERRRGLAGHATPDCRWGRCTHCGMPGDGRDIVLAGARTDGALEPELPRRRRLPAQPPLEARYRFRFAKTGDARFLSHRNVMTLLERALRAAGAPVRYTEGFNPHIRLSMGPALPLGHESVAEFFDVECHAPLPPAAVERANRTLPAGLRILAAEALAPNAPGIGRAMAACRYSVRWPGAPTPWPTAPPPGVAGVLAWEVDGEVLAVTLDARPQAGTAPSVRQLLAACGVAPERLPEVRVRREATILAAS